LHFQNKRRQGRTLSKLVRVACFRPPAVDNHGFSTLSCGGKSVGSEFRRDTSPTSSPPLRLLSAVPTNTKRIASRTTPLGYRRACSTKGVDAGFAAIHLLLLGVTVEPLKICAWITVAVMVLSATAFWSGVIGILTYGMSHLVAWSYNWTKRLMRPHTKPAAKMVVTTPANAVHICHDK
jgi:hypothetical protein